MIGWFRERRRHKVLEEPFPAAWEPILAANVPLLRLLNDEETSRLRDDLRILIAEKNWEGAGGLDITDEMRVTIAADACLLTLNLDRDLYANVDSILVYPNSYTAPQHERDPAGVVTVGRQERLGEAWQNGPVVLAWSEILDDRTNVHDGHNVVIHEFAHKLDMRDGEANGVPILHEGKEYDAWAEVMSAEYARLVQETEHHRPSLLNHYGATNAAEFFAVATECFFEKAVRMAHEHPRMYDVLKRFYRQDPASREPAHPEANS